MGIKYHAACSLNCWQHKLFSEMGFKTFKSVIFINIF